MRGSSSITTSVPVNATTAVALAESRVTRVVCVVANTTGTLYLKYGEGASDTSYTHKLVANDEKIIDSFTGKITGIKASGNTTVYVTEVW